MTPPFSARRLIISSLILRSNPGVKCLADECEAIAGTCVTSIT